MLMPKVTKRLAIKVGYKDKLMRLAIKVPKRLTIIPLHTDTLTGGPYG